MPQHPTDDFDTYRAVSLPVLLATLVLVAGGGIFLYFWHDFQAKRGARTLLDRAERLVEESEAGDITGGYAEAASLYFRYTRIRPDETAAQIRLAELFEKTATDAIRAKRATALLQQALVLADNARQQSLRRSLIELLLKQQKYVEAENEARQLSRSDGDVEGTFEAARLLALALFGRFQQGHILVMDKPAVHASLIGELRTATGIKMDPQLCGILAYLLRGDDPQLPVYPPKRQSSQPPLRNASDSTNEEPEVEDVPLPRAQRIAEADALMEQLVAQRPADPLAWLVSFNYRTAHELPGAANDLQEALRVGGEDARVRLVAASAAQAAAREIMARNNLVTLPPDGPDPEGPDPEGPDSEGPDSEGPDSEGHADSATDLANAVNAVRQHLRSAVEHYQYILEHLDARHANAILGLGTALVSLGESAQAIAIWKEAIKNPAFQGLTIRYYLTQHLLNSLDFAGADQELPALEKEVQRLAMRPDGGRFAPLKRSIDLMRAKVLAGTGEPRTALERLETLAAGQPDSPSEAAEYFQAHCLAGECHRKLGRLDLAAQSFEKAAEVASSPADQAASRVSAAAAWKDAGAEDNAIANCQRAVNLRPTPEAYLLLAQLLLVQQQLLPAEERNWNRFQEAVKPLRAAADAGQLRQSWRVELLEADGRLAQATDDPQQIEEARQNIYRVARGAEDEFSTDESLARQLVFVYQRLDKPEDADRVLKNFQTRTLDAVARQLVEANLLIQRRQFPTARAALQQLSAELSSGDRLAVGKVKARIAVADGQPAEAAEILGRLAREFPDDLDIARMRWQVIGQLDDPAVKTKMESELLEGNQDDWALANKIQRLAAESTSDHDAKFREATRLLGRLEAARPSWSVVYSLRGEITEKRATFASTKEQKSILAAAARAYERAIALGDQTLSVHERLVSSLYRTEQFAAAKRYLARIDKVVPLSSSLTQIAVNVALREGGQQEALKIASRAAAARPQDVVAQVSYGLLLLSAQQPERAQQVLTGAVKAAPRDDRAWNGLFSFYLRTNNKEKARETLRQMMEQADMPRNRRAFILAQGYEALDDFQKAETAYQEAVKQSPDEQRQQVQLRMAQFYMAHLHEPNANCQQKAAELLRHITAQGTGNRKASRMLQLLQAIEGGEEWDQLLATWRAGQDSQSVDARDQRFRAALLFRRGGVENLQSAREIFETLVASLEAEPNDRLMLARIADRQGDTDAARTHYDRLAAQLPPDVDALVFSVDFLIRQGDLVEANRQLQTLLAAHEPAFRLDVLELQARLLIAQGKGADVEQLIEVPSRKVLESLAEGESVDKLSLLGNVGNTFMRLDLPALAERWYRQLIELAPSHFSQLAVCLARQSRMGEALDICEDAWTRFDAAVACQTLADVLNVGSPSTEDYERAEPILTAAETKFQDNSRVLQKLANVRMTQKRKPDAIRLLEQTARLDNNNLFALNGLALILSERPERRPDALRYVDRAIAVTGPRADLYGLKGSLILYDVVDGTYADAAIRQTQLDEAIALLKSAVGMDEEEPRYRFHLAAGYFGAKNMGEAAKQLREAVKRGFEDEHLTEPDQKLMAPMQGLLDAASLVPTSGATPVSRQQIPTTAHQ